MLYQWGSDAMDWINKGLLDNNIYSNAHNEWLTLLVEQGFFGVTAYIGILSQPLRICEKDIPKPGVPCCFPGTDRLPDLFPVYFQHVLSTPFVFALLGMAEGVLCKVILIKS